MKTEHLTSIVNLLTGTDLFKYYRSSKDILYDILLDSSRDNLVQIFQRRIGLHSYCVGSHPRWWVWERECYNIYVADSTEEGFSLDIDLRLAAQVSYGVWWAFISELLSKDELDRLIKGVSDEFV